MVDISIESLGQRKFSELNELEDPEELGWLRMSLWDVEDEIAEELSGTLYER